MGMLDDKIIKDDHNAFTYALSDNHKDWTNQASTVYLYKNITVGL